MVEMELNKIVIDEKRHDQLIVLKEKNGNRVLPIVIGLAEASAIKLKISGFNPSCIEQRLVGPWAIEIYLKRKRSFIRIFWWLFYSVE